MQISVTGVSHTFRSDHRAIEVLRDLALQVRSSERISIVGPSGAGKTTLLRIVAGLLSPSSGHVRIDNRAPAKVWRDGRMGIAFQDPVLLPWRNVLQNVALPFQLLRRKGAPEQQIDHWLAATHLDGFAQSYPDELSGGMRSRVAVARCFVTSPGVALMDEPFNGLDEVVAQSVIEEVNRIVGELRASLIFVSHNIQQATFVADRVIVLSPRPAEIVADIPVNLPWPRATNLLADPSFFDIVNRVRKSLYGSTSSRMR